MGALNSLSLAYMLIIPEQHQQMYCRQCSLLTAGCNLFESAFIPLKVLYPRQLFQRHQLRHTVKPRNFEIRLYEILANLN